MFQKELFNSLVAKEKWIVKMVDGSACKIIGTGIIKITERDEIRHALEAIRYVLVQSNIHKGTRRRRMSDPSAIRCRHS